MGEEGLRIAMAYVLQGAEYLYGIMRTVIRVNYEMVTAVLYYCVQTLKVVHQCVSVLLTVLYNVISSGVDFLNECCNFLYGIFMLIWKFSRFIASMLDIVFRAIELLTYAVLSGLKSVLSALYSACINIKLNSYSWYVYISDITTGVFKTSSGAVALVWEITSGVVNYAFHAMNYLLSLSWQLIDNAMFGFAESVRFLTDQTYFFLVYYLPNIPKETYLGLITLLLLYIVVISVLNQLSNRDMTFPILNYFGQPSREWEEMADEGNFEFSDDDVNVSEVDSEIDNESLSDDDDDEEEDIEFEVTDDSDDSDGTSTTLSNDIDIQLPPTTNARYNLRRSTTPSYDRQDDFEHEIEKERERQKCVVCQDQNKSVLILPCRHMCLCVDCGNQIARARNVARRTCPLCRQKIRTIMNVYV
ncbi:E3 ubiquitin-protein ligase RNF26-like [Argopecten irradians]|uniref:E3 ubiquitin-protein ligase RNF26-like n=1 Tax=Argopecten irradians TaxID=31199 RepID=UPI003722B97D